MVAGRSIGEPTIHLVLPVNAILQPVGTGRARCVDAIVRVIVDGASVSGEPTASVGEQLFAGGLLQSIQ
jgi:hypothetical protein